MCDRVKEPTGKVEPKRKPVISGQAREMVFKLRMYFEEEKKNTGPLLPVVQVIERTAAALKISPSTVARISREKYGGGEKPSAKLRTPGKNKIRKSRLLSMSPFQENAIRQHVYQYYRRKEYPTLHKLLSSLKEAGLFSGGRTALSLAINKLGFQWHRFSGRRMLLERQDISSCRGKFLRCIREIKIEKIVWLDETWVNAGYSVIKNWMDFTSEDVTNTPVGQGGRVILLHAGTSKGFVPNSLLLFRSRKTVDCHEEMTSDRFTVWFKEQLLPNIEKNSVIVMDNAPYHSVQISKAPTQASRKEEIFKWLLDQNVISVEEDMTKAEMLEYVAMHKDTSKNYIDELAKDNGHKVLRLPPYCHFNVIEMVWAQVKGYVARNNKTFKLDDVEKLIHKGIEEITPRKWADVVMNTQKTFEEAWKTEAILEECIEEMIIKLLSRSSSESETESQEQDDDDEDEEFTPVKRRRLDESGASTSSTVIKKI